MCIRDSSDTEAVLSVARKHMCQLADTVEGKVRQTKVMVSTAKENLISSAKQMVQTLSLIHI